MAYNGAPPGLANLSPQLLQQLQQIAQAVAGPGNRQQAQLPQPIDPRPFAPTVNQGINDQVLAQQHYAPPGVRPAANTPFAGNKLKFFG